MLKGLLILVHVIVSVFLILVVLLQTGKRADLAGAFGGGGSQTAFGARGAATLLSKLTTAFAVIFMISSLGLAIISVQSSAPSSVLDDAPVETGQTAPSEAPAGTGDTAESPVAAPDADEAPSNPAGDDGAPGSNP